MIFPNLFKPGAVGRLVARNRLIMPAMHTNLGSPEDGIAPDGIDFYVARARGGFGQIGVGIIDSFQFGHASPGEFLLDNARHVSVHAGLVRRIKAEGALSFAQIGLRRIWALNQMRRQPSLSEFTDQEIRTWILAVIDTAKRAADAGYDGIDLLGNGGGAISIFTSQVFNDRDDEWGGNEERRLNFALAIVRGIRGALGYDMPMSMRLHGAEFLEGGYGLDVSIRNARRLADAGVDLFNVTAGGHATTVPNLTPNVKDGSMAILAHAVRQGNVNAKIAASTRITDPFAAEEVLRKGWADFISLARSALADPDWPRKAETGAWDRIRPCVACNECLDEATVRERSVRCLVNPRAGRHSEIEAVPRAETLKKVIIVGGGCVGLQAAITVAERGHDVHLYERANHLGGKWLASFAPPGRGALRSFLTWLVQRAIETGVKVHLGTEATPALLEHERPDDVILTVGAVPVMPDIPGTDLPHVVTGEQVLKGETSLGRRVVVVGGGGAGIEVAHFIATLHEMDRELEAHLKAFDGYDAIAKPIAETRREVFLIGRNRRLGVGLGPATRWVLVSELQHDGVTTLPGAELVAIGPHSVMVKSSENTNDTEIVADTVVICTGYRANDEIVTSLGLHGDHVHVVGDAKTIDHAMEGIAQAYDIGRML